MAYDVDYDYPFHRDELEVPYLPDDMTMDGNLYVLDNGRYLPRGLYRMSNGGCLIYEPRELSPFADTIASFNERR